jgi:hypothetical protein
MQQISFYSQVYSKTQKGWFDIFRWNDGENNHCSSYKLRDMYNYPIFKKLEEKSYQP